MLLDAMCASNGGPFTDIHDLYLHSMVPMAWMRGGEDAREDPPSSSAAAAPTAYNTSSEGKKKQVEKDDSSEEKKKKNFSKESPPGADFTEHLKHDMRTDADKSAARDAHHVLATEPTRRGSRGRPPHLPSTAVRFSHRRLTAQIRVRTKVYSETKSLLRLPFPNPY